MPESSAAAQAGSSPFTAQTRLRVRYAETDQMGVVYYANYLIWMEIGRVELLRQAGFDYRSMELEDDCHIPVVEATCRYKAPARYDDEIVIQTTGTVLRGYILKFTYRVLRDSDGKLLAEGETAHVITDRQMQRKLLPEKYVVALNRKDKSV
ncbi:MAG TPA: thioesterase family protein [Acidobacteriaceae bacterium]|nr:thioesterase family protein [Acidobacteriaceae bacterium]